MLSPSEIKKRFFQGEKRIDRQGLFLDIDQDVSLAKTLHYALLDGLSDEDAMTQLQANGSSLFEARFVLKQTHVFITDILEINVEDYQRELQSTVAYCYRLLEQKLTQANTDYENGISAPIEFDGHSFDASATTLATLSAFVGSNNFPTYWVDANNEAVEDWTEKQTRDIYSAITSRNAGYHEQLTAYKIRLRALAEQGKYSELETASLELYAL